MQLNLRLLDDDVVLIEGNQNALRFLASLLQAVASDGEEKVTLSPNGPGSVFFDTKSKLGFYINKI